MAKRKKGPVNLKTEGEVIAQWCRIRDKAMDDVEYSVVNDDYKGYIKCYRAARDAVDELIKLLKLHDDGADKIRGNITLEFLPAKED